MPELKSIYFLSDAHIGKENKKKEIFKIKAILSFLDQAEKDADSIYFLGDIFEFFFEFYSVVYKEYFELYHKIRTLADRGVKIYYIVGNHDAWHIDFFRDKLRVVVFDSQCELNLDGKRVFIHHGDGLYKGELGYRLLRWIIRSGIFVWFFRLLHPDLAKVVARVFSCFSSRSKKINTSLADKCEKFAKDKLNEGFDVVIMGHTHMPCLKRIGSGIYINTGDWINKFSYVRYRKGEFFLEYWSESLSG